MQDTNQSEAAEMQSMSRSMAALLEEIPGFRTDIGRRLDSLDKKVDSVEDRVQALEANQSLADLFETQFDMWLAELERREEKVTLKLDDLENRERRSNLRFLGIPEQEGETKADIVRKVKAIICTLFDTENTSVPAIDRAHRAGGRAGGPRSVLVKFHYYRRKPRSWS